MGRELPYMHNFTLKLNYICSCLAIHPVSRMLLGRGEEQTNACWLACLDGMRSKRMLAGAGWRLRLPSNPTKQCRAIQRAEIRRREIGRWGEAVPYFIEAWGWEAPSLEWLGLGRYLFNDLQYLVNDRQDFFHNLVRSCDILLYDHTGLQWKFHFQLWL